MKAYIYKHETKEVVAEIKGDNNKSIDAKFQDLGYDDEGLAYSLEGLITDGDFEVIDIRG